MSFEMNFSSRYVHTNIVARDWRILSRFYQEVFGCVPVPPQRSLSGQWLEKATGVTGAQLEGIHLKLPGYGSDGPTLEIFQYHLPKGKDLKSADRLGYAHLAFHVSDLPQAFQTVLESGGSVLGEITKTTIAGVGDLECVYVKDPEGNIIELQHWAD